MRPRLRCQKCVAQYLGIFEKLGKYEAVTCKQAFGNGCLISLKVEKQAATSSSHGQNQGRSAHVDTNNPNYSQSQLWEILTPPFLIIEYG